MSPPVRPHLPRASDRKEMFERRPHRSPCQEPVPLSAIRPGQRFALLTNASQVFALVRHPTVDAGEPSPQVHVVCIDSRAGIDDEIGRVRALGRAHLVFPLARPLAPVYTPA